MSNPTYFLTYEDFAAISPGEGFTKLCPPPYRNLPEGRHTGGPWLSPDGSEVWKLAHGGRWINNMLEVTPTAEAACMQACAGEPGFLPLGAWRTGHTGGWKDGWDWIIKPRMVVVEEGVKVSRQTAITMERAVRAMNELGWVMQDNVRVATYQGKPILLDLSTARFWAQPSNWSFYDDQSYVNRFFRWHGHDRLAALREAAQSIWNDYDIEERYDLRRAYPFVYATDCLECELPTDAMFIMSPTGIPCQAWVASQVPVEDEFVFKNELEWVTAPLTDRRPPTKGQRDV